jgi:para-nitrobenzyl esterase
MNENLLVPQNSTKIFGRRALLSRGAAAAAFAVGGLPLVRALAAESGVTFESTAGKLRGTDSNGVKIFKGVPYGASTDGAARFLPAQKPAPWAGVRDALEYGPSGWQGRPLNAPANPLTAMSD